MKKMGSVRSPEGGRLVELMGERSLIPPGFAVGGALRFREQRWRSAWRIRQGS